MLEQNRSFNPMPGRRRFGLWLASCALIVMMAPAAFAQGEGRLLDAPRAAGLVGERFDGLAVARGSLPPDVAALVARVNAERSALYAQRAAAQGVPALEVGKVYAAEILKSAPAGTWFLAENGQWTRR
jgi:uncharacterized protein